MTDVIRAGAMIVGLLALSIASHLIYQAIVPY